MTSIAGDNPASRLPRSRTKTAAEWGGHHWIAFLLAGIAVGPFLARFSSPWDSPLRTAVTAVMALALFLGLRHDAKLCERCAVRMPLDGNAEAARHARQLHLMHRPALWLALVLAGLPMTFLPPWWAAFAGEVAAVPLSMYAWVSSRTHRRLYPWCPRCNWGDGGDGIREPSPDPSIDAPSPQMA